MPAAGSGGSGGAGGTFGLGVTVKDSRSLETRAAELSDKVIRQIVEVKAICGWGGLPGPVALELLRMIVNSPAMEDAFGAGVSVEQAFDRMQRAISLDE